MDFVQGWIKVLDPDHPREVSTFATGLTRPVDLTFAPDGGLYVLLRDAWVIDDKFRPHTGSLIKITGPLHVKARKPRVSLEPPPRAGYNQSVRFRSLVSKRRSPDATHLRAQPAGRPGRPCTCPRRWPEHVGEVVLVRSAGLRAADLLYQRRASSTTCTSDSATIPNRIFKKHGIEIVGFWTPQDEKDGKGSKLVYLIAFPSREAAKKSWEEFRNDPEWQKVYAESHKNGVLVKKVDSVFLDPTDYSPIK